MSNAFSSGQPIFILGIMQRSGTNFLADLLRLHPDCDPPAPIWEDFVLHHADLLVRYARVTSASWRHWVGDETVEDSLYQAMGMGLLAFLTARCGEKRLLTKTPSVRNLQYFFKFFPQVHLLILVRDGRAVVESTLNSFKVNFESATHQWAQAADTILRFDEAMQQSHHQYLIVRYEDLWDNLATELRRIFDFLDLDPKVYDFEAAAKLPVRGSSVFGKEAEEKVHWTPVAKSAEFNPLQRWAHWNRSQHERFNWVAGKYLRALGYDEKLYPGQRTRWATWNKGRDVQWRLEGLLTSLGSLTRRLSRKIRARLR
jgi:hypothetical protein